MQIHQIVPTLSPNDAIGNEVLLMQSLFRKWGYISHIFADNWHPNTQAIHYQQYKKYSHKKNILIYHYGIGNDITKFIKGFPDHKILLYHNITPSDFFINQNGKLYQTLKKGREELPTLVPFIEMALGDSEYNRKELDDLGFTHTNVLPIIIDFNIYNRFNSLLVKKYSDDYVNILFVGRISPNKKQDDLIRIFHYFKSINPKSRLILVGGAKGCERYLDQLKDMVKQLNISDVIFTGLISFEDLISYYKVADIFICMSEHEGFCVPLVESMFFNIPIIAYNSTAIPYTLGNSGVLINEKKIDVIAEMINLVIEDDHLRTKIIEKQNLRYNDFNLDENIKRLQQIIDTQLIKSDFKCPIVRIFNRKTIKNKY